MSNDNEATQAQPPSPTARPRRSSIAELFRPDQSSASATRTSSLSTAMAQAQQQSRTRRLSITALGLSGSPTRNQPASPFGSIRDRGISISESSAGGFDDSESAIAEDGEPGNAGNNGLGTMGRRMSAGAKAYSEGMRRSSGANSASGTSPVTSGASANAASKASGSPPSASKSRCESFFLRSLRIHTDLWRLVAEGFNFGDTFRTRAERGSISGSLPSAGPAGSGFGSAHMRKPSQAESQPQVASIPTAPRPVQQPKKPDHFQERILKGDFYMD
ncbi:hypothetical protein FH972_021427 [Carpinus fangiana]|uniref:Uncharacterized protein n=1 Tax=Carpinus fangiana TaxID=176857 RepID=A0A5N6KPM8_9ROSI|nr:hypothetical protein FH972_021427 [Carpinus fangiana]